MVAKGELRTATLCAAWKHGGLREQATSVHALQKEKGLWTLRTHQIFEGVEGDTGVMLGGR